MRRQLRIFAAVAIVLSVIAPTAHAETAPDVFITEVQTSSANSGSEEFVELYNNTDQPINLADTIGWKLQYFSSTKVVQPDFSWQTTTPTGEIALVGTIEAHTHYLLSTYAPNNASPDQTYSGAHFANSAGGVQLCNGADARDHIGWSNADPPPNDLSADPPPGGSLQRPVDDQGSYLDAGGNPNDFIVTDTATPKESWQMPADTTPPPSANPAPSSSDTATTLRISELLPNPASPATDSQDEFVELYNDGVEAVDLRGFTIQTGLKYAYSYTIPAGTLAPHAYMVFTSGDTPLALANSGSQARLLNPDGQVVDETVAYSDAPEGQSWALFNDTWQWTTTVTPGAENVLTVPTTPPTSSPTSTKKSMTVAKVKKAAVTKATTKPKKTTAGSGGSTNDTNGPAAVDQPPVLHPMVLAGVGGAALLYGAYEYKADLANRLYQLKRYRATRRAARTAAKGA